jgi:hypothetical protein
MNKLFVFSSKDDGGVCICCPTEWAMRAMCGGGAWPTLGWYYQGFHGVQIERMVARGIRLDVAERYANAMMAGGCSTSEALEIIRDRDCEPVGFAIEMWDVEELPRDRWFRNAWRRSPNGGPIRVSLERARLIQFQNAREAVDRENKQRDNALVYQARVEVDWVDYRKRIMRAGSVKELRRTWPKGIYYAS